MCIGLINYCFIEHQDEHNISWEDQGIGTKDERGKRGAGGSQRKAETMAEEERVEGKCMKVQYFHPFSKSNLLKSATPTENLASY